MHRAQWFGSKHSYSHGFTARHLRPRRPGVVTRIVASLALALALLSALYTLTSVNPYCYCSG